MRLKIRAGGFRSFAEQLVAGSIPAVSMSNRMRTMSWTSHENILQEKEEQDTKDHVQYQSHKPTPKRAFSLSGIKSERYLFDKRLPDRERRKKRWLLVEYLTRDHHGGIEALHTVDDDLSLDTSTWKISKKHGLVVLDLNGTLIYRTKKGKTIHPRPYLHHFLDTLFPYFHVMVWSSARPESVRRMIKEAFAPRHQLHLIDVWDREDFGLTKKEYLSNTSTVKHLSRIRNSFGFAHSPDEFNEQKMILVEDERIKVADDEVRNWVSVSTWNGNHHGEDDQLLQLSRWFDNVIQEKRRIESMGREWDFRMYNDQNAFKIT